MAEIDETKAEEFAGRMLQVVNDGFIALATSIGHQTGLFDAMADLPPSTSAQIAEAAGLDERYVREWLGAVVTGGIVDHDPAAKTYHLPPEHALALTRAAGPDNLATLTQWIACMGSVEHDVIECFRRGGGVPYSSYQRFHRIMADANGQMFEATLVDGTLPLVPGLVERLQSGAELADVGCGSGHAVNLMAQAFPASRFTGYDFSEEGIEAARDEAEDMGLTNASFELKDVTNLGVEETFDVITAFDAIHDQARPRDVLASIAHALKHNGTFLMVDVAAQSDLADNLDHPLGPFLYTISTMHCMTVSLALDGDGLGAVWGEQKARELLGEAGFSNVDVKTVPGDIVNYYYIATRD